MLEVILYKIIITSAIAKTTPFMFVNNMEDLHRSMDKLIFYQHDKM